MSYNAYFKFLEDLANTQTKIINSYMGVNIPQNVYLAPEKLQQQINAAFAQFGDFTLKLGNMIFNNDFSVFEQNNSSCENDH